MPTKNNNGFTLLEVIISIAALSIISIFILQMFLASSSLNNRAKDTDIAVNRAITEIENLKKHSALSSYLEADAFGDISKNNGTVSVQAYYSSDWESVSDGGRYCVSMYIAPILQHNEEDVAHGVLYSVQVYIEDLTLPGSPLASLTTKKYFKSLAEGV